MKFFFIIILFLAFFININKNREVKFCMDYSCDTISYDEIYNNINLKFLINIDTLEQKITKQVIYTNDSTEILTTISFFGLENFSYLYCENNLNPNEYIKANNKKYLMDSLYYENNINVKFNSLGSINAYIINVEKWKYIVLFIQNFSCGMFQGTSLLIFSYYHELYKLIYFNEQLSEDTRCFGSNEQSDVLFYEWTKHSGGYDSIYYIYRLDSTEICCIDSIKMNIEAVSPFMLKYCK